MKRKREEIRQIAQRALPSSFVFRRVIPGGGNSSTENEFRNPSKSSISLSEFLSRKVDKPNEKAVQEKQCCFTSVTSRISSKNQRSQNEEPETSLAVHGSVFENFKNTVKDKDQTERNGEDEVPDMECPALSVRKDNNPFAGQPTRSSYLVVLGDDPKPKQMRSSFPSKRPDRIFNHYANGNGWWDFNMEGVDQEEVGCNEAWESKGATTLGGLEWH
ncbi:hypothetical protein H6P81_013045 [Aristolochia fimbriata]|uniref:Uncharacterized protein n=1 Tax=Aristolochia fimbriata TaxID=158543 RepID=A0AAV7EDJ3_ARIFI|nr:hypothetical protein H6P81_013045 [Aristolochia fimbriata]